MAQGFNIADFFAKLSIKADTKEVEKIEKSLEKVQKSLQMINKAGEKTAKVTDKVFKGEDLKRKKLLLVKQLETLRKLGGATSEYGDKLKQATKVSEFKKMQNEIDTLIIKQRRLNEETAKRSKIKSRASPTQQVAPPLVGPPTRDMMFPAAAGFLATISVLNKKLQLTEEKQREFTRRVQAQEKALSGTKAEANKAKVELTQFLNKQIKGQKEVDRLTKKLNSQQKAMRRLRASTLQLAQSFLGAFAIFEGVRSINRVGQDFEGMRAAMLASSGSSQQAAKDLAFVREEAHRLGLDLKSSTDAFLKLQFAARGRLSTKDTRDLFVGFSEFATALQVRPEQQKAGLRALQQMINKGQIMAEELKNQLSEQIPGSMRVFEEALGVTTQELFKMMERGELLAKDVLPKVAKVYSRMARDGGALAKALASVRVQQQRLTLGLQEAQDTVFKTGFGEGFADLLSELSLKLKDLIPATKLIGQLFKVAFDGIRAASSFLITPIETLGRLGEMLGLTERLGNTFSNQFVPKMVAAALLLRTSFGRFLVILEAIVGALEETVALSSKGIMGELERRLGRDIGSEFLGQQLGLIPTEKPQQLKSENIEKQFATTMFGVNDRIARQLAGEQADNTSTLIKAMRNMFSNMNVNVDVNMDEFGNATANSQIQMEAANAQAQR